MGSGLAFTNRDSRALGRFCMLAICWRDDRADCMSGSRSRGSVRVTVFSRNSLAKTVWAVMEESPSKAETASSSSSAPYSIPVLSVAAGEGPRGWVAGPVSTADADTEGLRLLMETVRSRSMFSMFARRPSKWSIFRSLC